jgi:hypothetical protein
MTQVRRVVSSLLLLLCFSYSQGQQTVSTSTNVVVPPVMNFSGVLTDVNGKPLTGVTGVTFLLYQESEAGVPLWMETQNVQPDKTGHYTVILGSTSSQGLPADIFVAGQAHWLAVQVQGQDEQPRVLLVSAPYALKAGDADTIGGLPASAFVLSNGTKENAGKGASGSSTPAAAKAAPPANPNVTGKGTVDYIPMWDTTSDIVDSVMFQKSSEIGIGTTAPAVTLDVNGKSDVRDTLTLFPKGTDSTLAVNGTAFKISDTGSVSFISGQTFPGAGTITGITTASTSGLQGGGTKGALTLSVKTAGITNTMLQNSKITLNANTAGGLTTPGAMTLGSTYTIGLKPCTANQILQYSGTVWNCGNAGTGTVTSVALTAPATDFVVSGSPVKTSGTLNFSWNVVPTSADTANAIVKRDSSGSFSASTITAVDETITDLLSIPSTGEGAITASSASEFATTIFANATSSTGDAWGVEGQSDSTATDAYGVFGVANATSGSPLGVYGLSNSTLGVGVFGQNGSESSSGSSLTGEYAAGVWGDGGTASGETGVMGTVDDGLAGFFANNSSTGYKSVFIQAGNTASLPFIAGYGATLGVLTAYCDIDSSGDFGCTGTKSAIVPIDGGARTVALSAVESPKNWFEDFGSGQLANGAAVVAIDPEYSQTVNTGVEYHVFLTPNGDCKGLYVTNKTATSFEVRELGGGSSSVSFDYRITALRKNYESVRFADHTHDNDAMKGIQKRAQLQRGRPQSHNPTKTATPARAAALRPVAVAVPK